MFQEFYGLREQPFGVTPDPRYLYLCAGHRETLASLYCGIEANRGFHALIARPGMGKTTLLFHLLEKLGESARTAFLFQTQCNSREFMRFLMAELGFDSQQQDFVQMHEQFNRCLLREARAGKRVVVVIDEAQNLEPSVLESVRLLSDFETPQAKTVQIILAGQPELGAKLADPSLIQLRQRISIFNTLHSLTLEETSHYIDHRLAVTGYEGPPLFTYEAKALIAKSSEGTPRNINNYCFHALSLGCALGQRIIDTRMVREVGHDLDIARLNVDNGITTTAPVREAKLSVAAQNTRPLKAIDISSRHESRLPPRPVTRTMRKVDHDLDVSTFSPGYVAMPVVTQAAAVRKPAVIQLTLQSPVKEPKIISMETTPGEETATTLPAKLTLPVISESAPTAVQISGMEPVLPTASVAVSANSASIGKAGQERTTSRLGHTEARASVASHVSVPTFGQQVQSHSTKKLIMGVVCAAAIAGYVAFFLHGGISVTADSKPSTSTTLPSTTTSPNNLTRSSTNPVNDVGSDTTIPATPETQSIANAGNNSYAMALPRENTNAHTQNSSRNNEAERRPAVQQTTAVIAINKDSVLARATKTPDYTQKAPPPVVIAAANTMSPILPVAMHVAVVKATPRNADALLLTRTQPIYPSAAQEANIRRTVIVVAQVDARGNVTSVKGTRGNPLLVQAAIAAVKQWKYSPAVKDDKAVSSSTEIQIDFSPSNNR